MDTLTELEREALDWLLAGEIPALEVLRRQASASGVESRAKSVHGFYTNFRVPPEAPRLEGRSVTISDVMAEIPGLHNPVGFVLFVEDGTIKMLEGYTIDDHWPKQITASRFYYERGASEHLAQLSAALGRSA